MKKEIIAYKNPKSPISEIFRTLRTNIQFMNTNKKMSSLLVTSTFPGEGKSWTASNLAVTFAQAGKKVVLIDADMRKGRQYSIFGASPTPGLSNYLSTAEITEGGVSTERVEAYIQQTEVDNLYLISSGDIPPNPSELLVSAQMVTLLKDLREICDLVIIDGTPCELVTDSVILSRLVDSTIIITAYKKTKKDALDRVVKNIKNVGGNIIGVVLNRMSITSKKYGEQYYYYGRRSKNKTNTRIKKKMETFNERVDENIMKLEEEIKDSKKTNEEASNIEELNSQVNIAQGMSVNDNGQPINEETKNNNNTGGFDKDFMEKTNEILKQINNYIDQGKTN